MCPCRLVFSLLARTPLGNQTFSTASGFFEISLIRREAGSRSILLMDLNRIAGQAL